MAKLVIRRGDAVVNEVELGDRDLRIGRGEQNDIVLADPDKTVSRFHAELRREGSGLLLIDLNSQNGIWVGGRRQPKVVLASGIPVTIGGFTLVLEESAPAAAPEPINHDATLVRPAPGAAPPPPAASKVAAEAVPESAAPASRKPAAPPAKPPVKTVAKTGAKPAAPGLIAYLARLPRPVLFGGFAAFIIIVLVLGQLVGPSAPTTENVTADSQPASAPAPSNEQVIAQHLAEAKALIERREYDEAVTAHLDQVLLIDPANAPALELKTRANELKAAPIPAGAINTASVPPAPDAQAAPAPAAAPSAPTQAQAARRPRPAGTKGPSELLADQAARDRDLEDRYDKAKASIAGGAFQKAVTQLADLQRDRPNYRDVVQLQAKAREGAQAQAQQALDTGTKLEGTGDLSGALSQYDRAAQGEPPVAESADQARTRVRGKMKTEGTDAFRRAKQYDALGRLPEAIALYERAARYLGEDDSNGQAAKERLKVLRARP